MSPQPAVSFVIPCHRCGGTLEATLRSIAAQQAACEVFVVTADPLDADEVARACRGATILALPERLGAGAARNRGAGRASGQLLAFVDADVVLPDGWLAAVRRALKTDPAAVASGAPVANANPELWPSRTLHRIEFSEFLPGTPGGVRPFLSSSNLLVRRQAFEQAGGFDESWEMAEDLELSLRLAGSFRLVAGPAVRHRHREEWSEVSEHLRRLGFWSGRLRASGRLSGAWLQHAPWLSFGLPVYRLMRVVARCFRAGPAEGLRAAAEAPLLLAGLWNWAAGFRRGLGAGSTAPEEA